MSESMNQVVETLDPVTKRILPPQLENGTLVPLKTTLELKDNLSLGHAYITRAPTRLTNDVVTIARNIVGEEVAKNMPHLRRCCKPADLPAHLKAQFMNGDKGRAVHTGKSNWLYIMLGSKDDFDYGDLIRGLSTIDGIRDDIFVGVIPVPLRPPTSQVQANLWSQQFWQTVYRKNNPLGPHPSSICRTTTTMSRDASVWMNLAHKIARQTKDAGYGEPIGAVIIRRTVPGKPDNRGPKDDTGDFDVQTPTGDSRATTDGSLPMNLSKDGKTINKNQETSVHEKHGPAETADSPQEEEKEQTSIVAIAGDARWHQQGKIGQTGNPMAHAALRAISMVAQKLVRAEGKVQAAAQPIEFESFQDGPLLKDEVEVFEADHPNPDGYLCHDLELYMTHEPCTMCAMAILHSRMGRIVFRHRMPLSGGMSSEDRGYDACGGCKDTPCGGGAGLGLHWRKELNWSMLGWEWEADKAKPLSVDPHTHLWRLLQQACKEKAPPQTQRPRPDDFHLSTCPGPDSFGLVRSGVGNSLLRSSAPLLPFAEPSPPLKARSSSPDGRNHRALVGIYWTAITCPHAGVEGQPAQSRVLDETNEHALFQEVVREGLCEESSEHAEMAGGKKRKLDPSAQKYYAVKAGKQPGVYLTWAECQAQTAGFKGAVCREFFFLSHCFSSALLAQAPRTEPANRDEIWLTNPTTTDKSFLSRKDAEDFAAGRKVASDTAQEPRYYAVAVGNGVGIYSDWEECSAAITNVKGPKYKKFESRVEALNFIRQFGNEAAQQWLAQQAEAQQPPAKKTRATKQRLDVVVPSELELDLVHIYTDGSSRANGRANAVAGVGVYFGVGDPRNISERLAGMPQTNNRAELTAILRALDQVTDLQGVRIFSDSNYAIKCVTEWYRTWQKNGWRKSTGDPVENNDLIKAIRSKIEARDAVGTKTQFQWVKGHGSDVGNIAADRLAVEGSMKTAIS
ncbi:uncharacterized protein B0I36DRAFT_344235 [Microdochium trichocladiopsis]|uniref:ribonuclease H n=1 Tax=Microdochium trichocladiopsis TaxID=1682393 RepID=A0A9P9BWD8_9PEZI|nr:uncharacterized protein B0I36DRAFT_344235 [Microdochium trichocladiopsis]KAH7040500.1 hypothetical protein B0I36DRAFT_344235 [Microdochium trichocladiopsis]